MIRLTRIVNIWPLFTVVLMGCADNHIWPKEDEQATGTGIAFEGSVQPSRTAVETRADGSLVNRLETQLQPTETTGCYVGVFGAYTGDNLWKDMTSPQPSADFFFNQKAEIGTDGKLTYTPERFWPNNLVAGAAIPSRYQYCSFWAYYPWNATVAGVGDKGVTISTDAKEGMSTGGGMGKLKFTMKPDAADQSDFMISELVADCSKDQYPLVSNGAGGWTPARVPFIFHHMLAQVRLYTIIKGADKLTYKDGEYYAKDETYKDAYGVTHTVTDEQAGTIKKIDETKSVRWKRSATPDKDGSQMADITYSISFNNIHTQALYTPTVTYSPGTSSYSTTFSSAVTDGATGSATVKNYIPNPYWFTFNGANQRVMLNDDFMYGYFEEAPSNSGGGNALGYQLNSNNEDRTGTHHYNYPPGNIILAVPQTLTDDDVPHVIIEVKGKDTSDNDISAKVTINLLNRAINWEAGFIYCYAFLDELMPGDDKVRGPETMIVVFDPERNTDQW